MCTRLPVAPGRPDEAQLQRVLDTINLLITAEASIPDAVIDLLGAVLVPDIQYHALLSAVKQEPGSERISVRSGGIRRPKKTYCAVT